VIPTDHFVHFTTVDEVVDTPRGIEARLHGERLRVDVVSADVVRVKISRGGAYEEQPTYAVCVDPLAGEVDFAVRRQPGVVRVQTDGLVLSLWLDPFRLDVHRPDGSPVVETAADDEGRYWAYATLNDAFTVRRRCRQEDAVYGLGEKTGRHNRKGRDYTLWNTDVLSPDATGQFTHGRPSDDPRSDPTSTEFDPYYVSVPFYHHQDSRSGAMAASFMDNGFRAAYDFTPSEEYRIHCAGGQYTEYIFAGPRMPAILTAYTWLTGRTPPPPLWSLGYHQCRWFDYTQETVETLAQTHREHRIPCDALWLDIEYMDGYRVFTWNTEKFPDPAGMLKRMSDNGFRVITIIDPGVKHDPGYWVFDQALERDVLCRTEGGDLYLGQVWPGNTAFPDFATEEARTWWGELNAAHVASGLAGIWNDMNEPATGAIDPMKMRFNRGADNHERFHNQYALLMAMATTRGLLDAMPGRRTFVLSRAGFAGIQRYAANWMGDNLSRWDHLRLSIPMASGFGVSGQAFVGADIGGFAGNADAELCLRWMQYGALTPFCRNHSGIGNIDQYAWSWGETIEALIRESLELRYRLLPYIYACFLTASATGAPVQRPLVFDHQDDPTVRDIDDEYLLGPDLLVAPVLESGMTFRQVYLPEGDWHDWHTGEVVHGRRFVVAPTPMNRIPLYARGGAVIPMWATAPASTADFHPETVELHLFIPLRDGTHQSYLQEDDGVTFAAAGGAHVRTTFDVTRSAQHVRLAAVPTGDGFPEFARRTFRVVVHGDRPRRVTMDGAEVAVQLFGGSLSAEIPNSGQPFMLELELAGAS
jgi:alpha-glucosidase